MITGRYFQVTTEISDDQFVVTTAQIDENNWDAAKNHRREVRVVGAFDRDFRVTELRVDRFNDLLSDRRDGSVRFAELEGIRPGAMFDARVRELAVAANCPALLPLFCQVGATALKCFRMGVFEGRRSSRPPVS